MHNNLALKNDVASNKGNNKKTEACMRNYNKCFTKRSAKNIEAGNVIVQGGGTGGLQANLAAKHECYS